MRAFVVRDQNGAIRHGWLLRGREPSNADIEGALCRCRGARYEEVPVQTLMAAAGEPGTPQADEATRN